MEAKRENETDSDKLLTSRDCDGLIGDWVTTQPASSATGTAHRRAARAAARPACAKPSATPTATEALAGRAPRPVAASPPSVRPSVSLPSSTSPLFSQGWVIVAF